MAARNMMMVGDRLTFWREDGSKAAEFFIDESPSPDVIVLRTIHTDGTLNTAFSLNTQTGVFTFPEIPVFSADVVVPLTNSTGVAPDNTIGDLTSVVAAAGEATAADLTTTQTAFGEVKDSLSDLAGKVNEILVALGIPAA